LARRQPAGQQQVEALLEDLAGQRVVAAGLAHPHHFGEGRRGAQGRGEGLCGGLAPGGVRLL